MLLGAVVVRHIGDDGFPTKTTHINCKMYKFGKRMFVWEPEDKMVTKYNMEEVESVKVYD